MFIVMMLRWVGMSVMSPSTSSPIFYYNITDRVSHQHHPFHHRQHYASFIIVNSIAILPKVTCLPPRSHNARGLGLPFYASKAPNALKALQPNLGLPQRTTTCSVGWRGNGAMAPLHFGALNCKRGGVTSPAWMACEPRPRSSCEMGAVARRHRWDRPGPTRTCCRCDQRAFG